MVIYAKLLGETNEQKKRPTRLSQLHFIVAETELQK